MSTASRSRSNPVYLNIARRLDLTNFADYCILNAYAAAMGDWPGNNWRAGKDRRTEWHLGVLSFGMPNGAWVFTIAPAIINSFTQTGGGPKRFRPGQRQQFRDRATLQPLAWQP